MTTLFQLTPDITLVLDKIGAVELDGKDLKVDVQGKEVKHKYANDPAAQAVYDALIAELGTFGPEPVGVNSGEKVRLRGDGNKRTAENVNYTILRVPDTLFPNWILQGDTNGKIYILPVDTDKTLEITV